VNCCDCGRFYSGKHSWAYIYDFVAMQPDYLHIRCKSCTDKLGPVHSNASPYDGDMSSYQGITYTMKDK
jgi:hypothetical protein